MVIKWTKSAFLDLKDFSLASKKDDINKYVSELFEYSLKIKEKSVQNTLKKSLLED